MADAPSRAEAREIRNAAPGSTREVREPGAVTSPAKTAVIVVHGMGEQRPLETIKEFVETIYQRGGEDPSKLREIAIVPDTAFDSAELRRLSTQADGPAKRTDFFEFYWADLMDGTPVEVVTSWIDGLLLRSPWRVPAHVRVYLAWVLLWALALIVMFSALATGYPDLAGRLGPVTTALSWVTDHQVIIGKIAYALGAVVLAITMTNGLRAGEARLERMSLWTPFILLVGGVALVVLPAKPAIDGHLLAAAITAGLGWLMHALVAPYVGDVVRYVRATPSTVERRRLIRARGLALLEAIHAERTDSSTEWNFAGAPSESKPAYDRILLVSHSLGTMVAYDILQMFWEKYGPTHHQNWLAGPAQDQLEAVDEFVKAQWVERSAEPFDLDAYLNAQTQLRKALFKEKPHWRITDFITLGSPLVHTEFLVTNGAVALETDFEQRRFAACPPRPDPIQGSMLYPAGPLGTKYPHFAAQFAAVRWTNICDETWFPLLGDLISGRLAPVYGPGIVEHCDRIERSWPWPFRRVFTHTEYWKWNDRYLKIGTPDHIRHLREALRLGD